MSPEVGDEKGNDQQASREWESEHRGAVKGRNADLAVVSIKTHDGFRSQGKRWESPGSEGEKRANQSAAHGSSSFWIACLWPALFFWYKRERTMSSIPSLNSLL